MNRMNRSVVVLAVAVSVALAAPGRSMLAQATEPCVRQFAAAALVANLQDIASTTIELRLLNGKEDPKLRRVLERRLAIAAAEARYHIGLDPLIEAPYLPALAEGVTRALILLRAKPLDLEPLRKEHEREVKMQGAATRNIGVPKENLEFVRDWVAKQPWSKRRVGAESIDEPVRN